MAFAKQTALLRHDVGRPVVPSEVRPGDDVVVLMHGMLATAGVLRPLRAEIGRQPGMHAAALSYAVGASLTDIASRLRELCEELGGDVRLHLVGHSFGGVAARLVGLESDHLPIVQTMSLAAPFAGIPRAKMLTFAGMGDLDPRSELLRRVRLGSPRGDELPHLSVVAGRDQFVRPPLAHALPGGDVHVLSGRGHNALLFDDEVARLVVQRVAKARRALACDPEA